MMARGSSSGRGRGRTAATVAGAACCIALLLAAAGAPAPAAAVLTPFGEAEWRTYLAELQDASANGRAFGDALRGVLDHEYSTPLAAVQASNVHAAAGARLRRVVADLLAGREVTVLAIGGPATSGAGASAPGRSDYFPRFVSYLARAFPSATVSPARAAVGVAPSGVVGACLDSYASPDAADLVLLELNENDAGQMDSSITNPHQPKAYEVIVRKLLAGARRPAVVLVQTMAPGQGNASAPFYLTTEAPHFAAVSGYYGLPVVSQRNALWKTGAKRATGLMATSGTLATDGATPTDAGHAALADGLVFLTQRAALDLQLTPLSNADAADLATDLPSRPMFSNVNDAPRVLSAATCAWVRNATVGNGGCPTDLKQMCRLDYSSLQALRQSYKDAGVKEAKAELQPDGSLAPSTRAKRIIFIVSIVAGVVGGLALVAGLIAFAVIKKKRRMAAQEAAFAAKMSVAAAAANAGKGAVDGAKTATGEGAVRLVRRGRSSGGV